MICNALFTHYPWRAIPENPAASQKSAICNREGYNPSKFARDDVKNRDRLLRSLTLYWSGREPDG